MTSGRDGRDIRLDVIRSVAILLVILIHAFEMCYGSVPWQEGGTGSLSFSLAFCLGRLGVPMFFMLTGYLVLSKDYSDAEAVRNFYRRSWSPLLITILLWATVYCVVYVLGGRSSPLDAVKYILLLENVPAGLWWFVPAIVSLYVAVPFVSRALDGLQARTLLIPAAFVLAYAFLVPTYNNCVAPLIGWGGVSPTVNVSYIFGSYGTYMVIGYGLRRWGWEGRFLARPLRIALVLGASVITGSALVYVGRNLWYNSLPIAAGGVALFLLILRLFKEDNLACGLLRPLIGWLSRTSFAAYFLHYIPLILLSWSHVVLSPHAVRAVIVYVGLLIVVYSMLAVLWFGTRRLPTIRRIIFHTR